MKNVFKSSMLILLLIVFVSSCKKVEDGFKPTPSKSTPTVVKAEDFTVTIDERPLNGTSLGFIQATVNNNKTLNYFWYNDLVGIADYIKLNETSGELTILDSSYFDYTKRQSIKAMVVTPTSNGSSYDTAHVTIHLNKVEPKLNVQQRLTKGETPFQIYQSNNALLDSLYGKMYEGGLIFYLNTTDGSGLVAAEFDQSTSIVWDPTTNFIDQVATGAISKEIGDGAANTSKIVRVLDSLNISMTAAHLCNDATINSKSDWFLPSIKEMDEMYTNLQDKGLGNFAKDRYWSSTEFDLSPKGSAIFRDFDTSTSGSGGTTFKYANNYVRAARAF